MKVLIVTGLIAVLLFSCKKEKTPGNEPKKPIVYISGSVVNSAIATQIPCYWKDTNLVLLDIPTGMYGSAHTIIQSNKNLYVLGSYGNRTGSDTSCIWENGIRTNLPLPSDAVNWYAGDMFVAGNDVFAAGGIVANGPWKPCYWKNGVYNAMNDSADLLFVFAIWVNGTDIYLAGSTANHLGYLTACYWKNGVRISLPALIPNGATDAVDIKVSGNDVLVAGEAQNASGIRSAVYWKNGVLHNTGNNTRSYATGIEISENDIYVAGSSIESGVETPCYWKNGIKFLLSESPRVNKSHANSIKVSSTDVHIAGEGVQISNGASTPCYWKNNVVRYLPLKNYTSGNATSIFIGE